MTFCDQQRSFTCYLYVIVIKCKKLIRPRTAVDIKKKKNQILILQCFHLQSFPCRKGGAHQLVTTATTHISDQQFFLAGAGVALVWVGKERRDESSGMTCSDVRPTFPTNARRPLPGFPVNVCVCFEVRCCWRSNKDYFESVAVTHPRPGGGF